MTSELGNRCIELNKTLLENLATQFSISFEELETAMKFVADNEKVFNMAKQLQPALKANPNLEINFGSYGDNIAKECGVEPEYLFKTLIYVAHNELIFNVTQQLSMVNKKEAKAEADAKASD